MTASRIYNLPHDAMLGREVTEEEMTEMMKEFEAGPVICDSFYATDEEARSPYASPICGDFKGFPRTLLECGEKELLYEDSVMLYEKMKADGVDVTFHEWEGLFHVFALLPMPEADQVCEEIAAFACG